MASELNHPPPSPALPAEARDEVIGSRETIRNQFLTTHHTHPNFHRRFQVSIRRTSCRRSSLHLETQLWLARPSLSAQLSRASSMHPGNLSQIASPLHPEHPARPEISRSNSTNAVSRSARRLFKNALPPTQLRQRDRSYRSIRSCGSGHPTMEVERAFAMNCRTSSRSLTPGTDSTPLATSTPQGRVVRIAVAALL